MPEYSTADRLKQIMAERNLKQVDILRLAKPYCELHKVRLGRNDLSQYLSGKVVPKQDKTYILAKALNVSESWLMGYEVQRERIYDSNCIPVSESIQHSLGTPYNPKIHDIFILGQIAAGLPLYAEGNIEGYTYTDRNGGADYFALKVKGDSMTAAQINDGNLIIVRVQNVVENGEIAIVRVNNEEATVKRFKQEGNIVHLIPQSFNPEHQVQTYNLKETKIEVIGKVVECRIEF